MVIFIYVKIYFQNGENYLRPLIPFELFLISQYSVYTCYALKYLPCFQWINFPNFFVSPSASQYTIWFIVIYCLTIALNVLIYWYFTWWWNAISMTKPFKFKYVLSLSDVSHKKVEVQYVFIDHILLMVHVIDFVLILLCLNM